MAWTTLPTFTDGMTLTGSQMAAVVANINETATAKATTAGGYYVATGTNALAERLAVEATVVTAETTTSTSATDLTTTGPAVSVATSARALVMLSGQMSNSTVNQLCFMGCEISGATTAAAVSANALRHTSSTADALLSASFVDLTLLTAGTNTFTAKYAVSGGTGTFQNRRVIALPF